MTRAEWQKEMEELGWRWAVYEQYVLEQRTELLTETQRLNDEEQKLKD